MTNIQLHMALGVPVLVNALLITILMAYINAKVHTVRAEIGTLRTEFTQMLLRVEGVLDARLKHLEEREH